MQLMAEGPGGLDFTSRPISIPTSATCTTGCAEERDMAAPVSTWSGEGTCDQALLEVG